MTAAAATAGRDQRDLYRSPGRIARVEPLHDSALAGCLGGYLFRLYFEDGRWLEVIGASPGWPDDWPEGV